MDFLEKDLEQIIFESSTDKLHERGLFIYGNRRRQVRIGNYGVSDMITHERPYFNAHLGYVVKGTFTIYEFKKDVVNISAFLQAVRYLKGLRNYLDKRGKDHLYNYRIKLVGKSIDLNSSFSYLTDIISQDLSDLHIDAESGFSLDVFTYSYDIDGVQFTNEYGYKLKDEVF